MLNYGIFVVIHFQITVRPSGKACDKSGNCQIHLAGIICPLLLVLIQYMMFCAGVFLNFIATCHVSDSELIRFIVKHAMFCARAQSPIGRNYTLCYQRYGFKFEDEFKSGLKSSCCNNDALKQMSATDYCHVNLALELIMLRTGIL